MIKKVRRVIHSNFTQHNPAFKEFQSYIEFNHIVKKLNLFLTLKLMYKLGF